MIARGAWIPGLGTYTIENSTSPQDPTVGDVRLDQNPPRDLNMAAGGDACGHIVPPQDLESHKRGMLTEFLNAATLANLAAVKKNEDGTWEARGDPTEIAIQVFAARFGMDRSRLVQKDSAWEDLVELPFDSDVKRMSVIMRNSSGESFVFTKGAVERVIQACNKYSPNESSELVDIADMREEILRNMEALAGMGTFFDCNLPCIELPHYAAL